MVKDAMKIRMTHVPYRGGAPMTADLIAGVIPVGIDVITALVPMVKA
jgi:tripartite-type tricarboxylate transporter receptor subunit TctC